MYLLYVDLEASSGFSQQNRVISLGDGGGLTQSFHPQIWYQFLLKKNTQNWGESGISRELVRIINTMGKMGVRGGRAG